VSDDEAGRWWTVPQAAVWIRTRDLPAVQALDSRQRVSLFMAADMIPGVFPAATDCLREALERGRLAVRGRMALPELAVTDGRPAWRLLGDRPELVPESFWQSGGAFTDDLEHGVVATAPGVQERWMDLVVEVDDCVGHWQAPESVLAQGRLPMNRVLPSESDDVAQWLLAHPDVVVTGVDGSGARVAIERGMFNNPLLIDRQNGVLMTQDGRMTWRAVELELAPSRAPSPEAEPLARWYDRPVPAPLEDSSLANRASQMPALPRRPPKPTEAEMKAWYLRRIDGHDPQQPPPSREDDVAAAHKHFRMGGLKDMVRRMRQKLAPDAWKQPGAKGRKRREHAAVRSAKK
jgi:hypothetical protein